jgi:hypothetical protein
MHRAQVFSDFPVSWILTLPFSVPRRPPALTILGGGLAKTLLAPHPQAVFACAFLVELTLGLPSSALGATLLFHTANNTMALFISKVSFRPSIILAAVLAPALFTPAT